jgi:hypothetical protein
MALSAWLAGVATSLKAAPPSCDTSTNPTPGAASPTPTHNFDVGQSTELKNRLASVAGDEAAPSAEPDGRRLTASPIDNATTPQDPNRTAMPITDFRMCPPVASTAFDNDSPNHVISEG